MRLPVLVAEQPEGDQVEVVSYQEKEYLVCDKKKAENGHISMKLVQKAGSGKYSGKCVSLAASRRPEKSDWSSWRKGTGLYVLGGQSSAYKSFLPRAVVLDAYVRKQLYLLPEAVGIFQWICWLCGKCCTGRGL